MSHQTVLVIGGHGFLGRHIVAAMEQAGYQLRIFPDITQLDLGNADDDQLKPWFADVSIIVNCAGRVAGSDSELYEANQKLPQRILTAANAWSDRPHLVHLGSMAEYGVGDGTPWCESAIPEPSTDYGRSKLAGTQVITQAIADNKITGWVLRVANPVGAGQPANSLAGAVLGQLDQSEIKTGRLDAGRDFISAHDVARAVVTAVATRKAQPNGAVINIASGRATVVRELVEEILQQADYRGTLLEENRAGSQKSVDTPVPITGNPALAKQLLDWQADDDLPACVTDLLRGNP